uniref:Uncharacterized protein n=1 Tax=Anopheles culicifacies TaxID=139723 RepID=A0A182MI22_9DIPT
MMTPQDNRDRIINTGAGGGGLGGRRRRWRSDSGTGGPLPAIGPSSFRAVVASSGSGNHSTATNTAVAVIATAHQNSINHQRAGSGGGGGYAGLSHGDVDNPISAKLNLTTSPSSERRRKKANKQHPVQQRNRKHENTHPTVDAAKLLQR